MCPQISEASSARLRPVTSPQNALVKALREAFAKGTTVDGLCAVEGLRLIEEAIRSSLKVHALFIRESAQNKAQRILDQLGKRAESVLLPDSVFDSAVLTEHPQGIAALIKAPGHDVEAALAKAPALVVVAAGVQDPGNFGTLVRSAEAFGGTAVIGIEGTVNPWNPKAVRASAGSVFRLAVIKAETEELISALHSRQIVGLALMPPRSVDDQGVRDGSSPRSPRPLQDADLTRACALFVGSEGAGLPRELISRIEEFVAIPQARVESLNAAVAVSIALYEAQRQRTAKL
jgi:RNA methyltransferase, TrmH family